MTCCAERRRAGVDGAADADAHQHADVALDGADVVAAEAQRLVRVLIREVRFAVDALVAYMTCR